MKIKPINGNILVELGKPEETTKSGIVLPESKKKADKKEGKVLAVATEVQGIKKGDQVLLPSTFGNEIDLPGKKTGLMIDADEVLGIIE